MRRVGIVLLAAGRSTRMGGPNKLLAPLRGEALVLHAARAALASRASRPLIVVTGHQAGEVEAALVGLEGITFVRNHRYADGLSTSLIAGVDALARDIDGAVVMLGDMPLVGPNIIDALIAAFHDRPHAGAVAPARDGAWGNPVLIARALFAGLGALSGDAGARKLLEGRGDVLLLPVEEDAPFIDADDPAALAALRSRLALPHV